MTRRGKETPRLPLSAFSPPNTGTSDTFPIPPTPTLISPTALVDAHHHIGLDPSVGIASAHKRRAVVLSASGHSAEATVAVTQTLGGVDPPVLAILVPFDFNIAEIPSYLTQTSPTPALAATYDNTILVAAEAEDDTKDQDQVEIPVKNLRWALQHGRTVDINIQGGLIAIDTSAYDSLVNLLSKGIKSTATATRAPIVLNNALPPPLDTITPVVTLMNHPSYNTYRQRVSSLSLFENVYVKLLPPTWVKTAPTEVSKQEKEVLKLFIVPVLEAFGFERIVFGTSPVFEKGSAALADKWYKLVLESFRELAVSQDEMNKIFIDNAERVYRSQ